MRQYDSYRASQPAYVHGSAAPDLRRQGNPDVNVMPGRRNGVNHAGVPESIFGVVGVVFAVAIVIAIFACARVLLSAASVTTTIATDELSTQIANERTLGNDLEVQQSQLSNSTHIRSAAEGLGMAHRQRGPGLGLPCRYRKHRAWRRRRCDRRFGQPLAFRKLVFYGKPRLGALRVSRRAPSGAEIFLRLKSL